MVNLVFSVAESAFLFDMREFVRATWPGISLIAANAFKQFSQNCAIVAKSFQPSTINFNCYANKCGPLNGETPSSARRDKGNRLRLRLMDLIWKGPNLEGRPRLCEVSLNVA
eukprot:m.70072 g.70072  ORF g.70072 m.70072 type:complete len:112 (+) comp35657_c0_seq1:438-773(+)